MLFSSWLRSLRDRFQDVRPRQVRKQPRRSRPQPRLLRLEALEDRTAPAVLTVNSLADTVSGTSATLDLREAIQLVNSGGTAQDASGNSLSAAKMSQIDTTNPFGTRDTIQFDSSLAGATIALTQGEMELSGGGGTVTIDASGLSSPVNIDGSYNGRIFRVDSGATVILSSLILQGGRTDSTDPNGGAAYNAGKLTVSNSTFAGNSASGDGGDIYDAPGSTLTVSDSALGSWADAGGAIANAGSLWVSNSSISGGAYSSHGGGIWNDNSGTVTVSNTTFSSSTNGLYNSSGRVDISSSTFDSNGFDWAGNSPVTGGGVYNADMMTISDSTFTNNFASSQGAGAYNATGGTLTVSDSTFYGNFTGGFANSQGAGVYNAGTLTVTNSTFANNSADFYGYGGGEGGALYNAGTLTVINSTVADNSATGGGGGIYFSSASQPSVLTNVTIAENSCNTLGLTGQGGGIYVDPDGASLTLNNTIVAENSNAPSAAPDDIAGTVNSASSHNLIGDGTGMTGMSNGGANGNQVGVDPNLAPLGDYGGPTQTMPLLPGSPALDAGSNALAVDANNNPLVYDQRGTGFTRASNGTVDIGAFEAQPVNLPTTFVVTTLSDEADAAPTPTGDPGPDGLLSLREAIQDANLRGPLDGGPPTITFAPGLSGTITLTGGELFISHDLTVSGPGAGQLAVSGNNASRVFEITSAASISGLTIENGNAGGRDGGGILYSLGWDQPNDATLTISNCVFSGNRARGYGSGGGIENNGGTLTISGSTFHDNSAFDGGGIFNLGGQLTVTASSFANNSARNDGGGIFKYGYSRMTVTGSSFAHNSAQDEGGGIDNGYGTLTVAASTFTGNSSGYMGGGIANQGALSVTNTTFAGNNAQLGGGIGTDNYSSGSGYSLSVTSCTLSGNSAFAGGGIWENSADDSQTVDSGGSWFFPFYWPGITLSNTIVAGNTATYGDPDVSGLFTSNGYNLIGDVGSSQGFGAVGDQLGTAANPINPLLAPLGDYGGPTQTMALLPGSPALDAGSNALAVDANSNPLTTDQRGFARLVNGTVDIGAFEMQAPPTAHLTNPTVSQSAGSTTVGFTLTASDPTPALQGGPFTYTVNWGDGTSQTIQDTANAGPVTHTYTAANIYKVSVTAQDQGLAVSPPATATVVVSSAVGDGITLNDPKLAAGKPAGAVWVTWNGTTTTYQPTDQVVVSGSGGSDVYTVNFGQLPVPVTVAAGGLASGDKLVVNGVPNSTTNDITKTAGSVAGQGTITWTNNSPGTTAEVVSFTAVPHVTINANGTRTNYIKDPGSDVTINGGPGTNTIEITATTGDGVVINGGPSTNNYVIDLGSLAGPVSIQNSNAGATDSLIVNGTAGDNVISVAGNQITEGPQTITDSAPLANLTINGGSGNNQLTVSNLTVPVGNLTLDGGGGNNTFTLNNVGSDVTAVTITPGSGGPGTNQVQVEGSLPATVNAVPSLAAVTGPSSVIPGQTLTLSAPFSVAGPSSTEMAVWTWGDGTTTTQSVSTASGTLATTHVYAASRTAPYTVTLTLTDDTDGLFAVTTSSVSAIQSIYVLNGTAGGALSLSGNSTIDIPGTLVVDSNARTALQESGNARITAAGIQVVGGVSKSGTATLSPVAVTGAAAVADPLASLTGPSTAGLTNYGSVRYSGSGSYTLGPGIYTQVSASGNASLTLEPGLYLIEGGGFTVTGNASVTGTGVTIYNTGSNYPNAGGSYGGITLSGTGTVNLTAPTSGPYAGVVIFQARANTRAISLSGSAADGLSGTLYAPAALLYLSGNANLQGAVVVNELSLTGNAASTQVTDGADVSGGDTAGQLLAGNLEVYVNDPGGLFTADQLARIQDAVNAVDAVVEPFGVSVQETTDPSLANVVIDTGSTSAVGGYANGVLGCYTTAGEITLIQGWNWYAGADPTQIGANQYDFETTLTHELGHALGLGEGSNPASAMYGTLAPGTVIRTLTTADLNIPYDEAGADAQYAAPFAARADASPAVVPARAVTTAGPVGPVGPADSPRTTLPGQPVIFPKPEGISLVEVAGLVSSAAPAAGLNVPASQPATSNLGSASGNALTATFMVWSTPLPAAGSGAGGNANGWSPDAGIPIQGRDEPLPDQTPQAWPDVTPMDVPVVSPVWQAEPSAAVVDAFFLATSPGGAMASGDADAESMDSPTPRHLAAGGSLLLLLGVSGGMPAREPESRNRPRWRQRDSSSGK